MYILILHGSPRKAGNTNLLCDAFMRGAEESGHTTEKVHIEDLSIHSCLGCNGCQQSGACVQRDDMQAVYHKLLMADAVVLASPIYFYTWSAQIKAVLDRTCALLRSLKNKTFYLIAAGVAPDMTWCQVMLDSYHRFLSCFDGLTDGGAVFGLGTDRPGDVMNTDAVHRAYQMGKGI